MLHLLSISMIKTQADTPDSNYILIQLSIITATALIRNNTKQTSQCKSKLTLYSKHDTQIVSSSSSLLSCEGGISAVQRWIRLLSAFFITHKKHTNRCRLVSAGKVAIDLPCWEEKRIFCMTWDNVVLVKQNQGPTLTKKVIQRK